MARSPLTVTPCPCRSSPGLAASRGRWHHVPNGPRVMHAMQYADDGGNRAHLGGRRRRRCFTCRRHRCRLRHSSGEMNGVVRALYASNTGPVAVVPVEQCRYNGLVPHPGQAEQALGSSLAAAFQLASIAPHKGDQVRACPMQIKHVHADGICANGAVFRQDNEQAGSAAKHSSELTNRRVPFRAASHVTELRDGRYTRRTR